MAVAVLNVRYNRRSQRRHNLPPGQAGQRRRSDFRHIMGDVGRLAEHVIVVFDNRARRINLIRQAPGDIIVK